MTNRNMHIWESNSDIAPQHTKAIAGKDYKGTSPDPQQIIKMLTKQFGPVGKGFGWNVLSEEFQPLGEGTLLHLVRIRFWWSSEGKTHEYESYGQTKAAYMAGKGDGRYLRTDEDAPKKSLTDAITKAASQLGFAANIYLGLYDSNKYVSGLEAKFAWLDEMERDSEFWDRVRDSLEPDATHLELASVAADQIWEKVSGYKTLKSLLAYFKNNKKRFEFIEIHNPDANADLMDKMGPLKSELEQKEGNN